MHSMWRERSIMAFVCRWGEEAAGTGMGDGASLMMVGGLG